MSGLLLSNWLPDLVKLAFTCKSLDGGRRNITYDIIALERKVAVQRWKMNFFKIA